MVAGGTHTEHEYDPRTHVAALGDGCVLLSREELLDPNFQTTIVLMCVYNNDGALGLVCNRPSHMPLSEVFGIDEALKGGKRGIYIGGPVEQEALHVVQITGSPAQHAHEIAPRVYLGGHWESISDILNTDPSTTRLFLGYSGWAPGQLEAEVAEGAWEVYNVDVKRFLTEWQEPLHGTVAEIRGYLLGLAPS